MSNMSYCRFRNTLLDMDDCIEHLDDNVDALSEGERVARKLFIKLCHRVASEFDEEDAQ